MKVTLCDIRDGKEPCGERASVEVQLRWDDKNWVLDACDVHAKGLTAHARVAESPGGLPVGYTSRTVLPRAVGGRKAQEQLVGRIDYQDLRAWLEAQGDLPAGSRGRIAQSLQRKWIDAGEPRPV